MKRNLINKLMAFAWMKISGNHTMPAGSLYCIVLAFILLSCTQSETTHEHDSYTCPMHPTVISDRPGTCPVCGMDLVRKARPGEEIDITEDLSKLLKSPNESVVASIRTIKGQYRTVPVSVTSQGVVTYDTRNISAISARVGGRLEKVYLEYVFQPVSRGQKIAEVYSPELITAQREFVFLLENDGENMSLIEASARKLALLGMTTGQVNTLRKTRQVNNTFAIYSPHSGYVITAEQTPSAPVPMQRSQSSGREMSDGMSSPSGSLQRPENNSGTTPSGSASLVREGDYVTSGQNLFTIVNQAQLRIELNMPGTYAATVEEGDSVQLDLGNGGKLTAAVDFVQPFFAEGQEFMKVRIYTRKTEGLHIGHLVNATIELDSTEALWVPKEAVLDLGTQQIVFIKDRDVLKPKQITAGVSAEGMVEIKSGLASTDEIAANAQYLVDSESFIKPEK